jgi:hypothetical protein
MDVMAKKKDQPPEPPEEAIRILLRVFDERLIEAIDSQATLDRRSRNLMMLILLEEALAARGVWPPPPPD